MPKIRIDDRFIKSIGWLRDDTMPSDYASVEVGHDGVDRIDVAEQSFGEYSICWFQVWRNKTLLARYNARNVDSILYFENE